MNITNTTKREMDEGKKDFALHVALLQRSGMKLAEARVKAWLDGPKGLAVLLAPLSEKST